MTLIGAERNGGIVSEQGESPIFWIRLIVRAAVFGQRALLYARH
jgi:hypothetical protein